MRSIKFKADQLITNRNLKIAVLSLLILVLTFVRENTFLVLNGAIAGGNSYKAYIEVPNWLRELTLVQLTVCKWTLTLFFIMVFTYLSYSLLNALFQSLKFNQLLLLTIATICVLSAFLFILSSTVSASLYGPARQLLSLVQSPILLMIIILMLFANQKFDDFVT